MTHLPLYISDAQSNKTNKNKTKKKCTREERARERNEKKKKKIHSRNKERSLHTRKSTPMYSFFLFFPLFSLFLSLQFFWCLSFKILDMSRLFYANLQNTIGKRGNKYCDFSFAFTINRVRAVSSWSMVVNLRFSRDPTVNLRLYLLFQLNPYVS